MLTESSLTEKGKIIAKLIGKYASSSVLATSVDFSTFHFALTHVGTTAIQSTILGRLSGALVAFSLHRRWVFKTTAIQGGAFNKMMAHYVSGILLGMVLNVLGVWLLNDIFSVNAWSSRIFSAAAVWFLVFSYNKNVVFKERIISEQDFTEEETEEDDFEHLSTEK